MAEDTPKNKAQMEKKAPVKLAAKAFAIVLIRSLRGATQQVKDTASMMRLRNKNVCVIYESSDAIDGMIFKIKDYITYGEIDDSTLKLLLEKRAEKDPKDPKMAKKFLRLHPPRGGFERKGIKVQFAKGGALGFRGAKVNDLIKKMI